MFVTVTFLLGCGARDELHWLTADSGSTERMPASTGGTTGRPHDGLGGARNAVSATLMTGGRTARNTALSGGNGAALATAFGGGSVFSGGSTLLSEGSSGISAGSTVSGGGSKGGGTAATALAGRGGVAGFSTVPTAGAAGFSAASEWLPRLIGEYDVRLDLAAASGCETLPSAAHLNLSIAPNAVTMIHVIAALDWRYASPNAFHTEGNTLVIERSGTATDQLVPEVRLELNSTGFSGNGTANVKFLCGTEERLVSVPALIGPDTTPPKLRAFGTMPGGLIFPFDLVLFEFSEMIVPDTLWEAPVHVFPEPEKSVRLVEPSTRTLLDYYWTNWPWGPATVVGFSERSQMNGRAFALDLLQPFADRAKNPAIAAQSSFAVFDVGLPIALIDFDAGERLGAFGRYSYFSAGSTDSPCEAGGCLALDYTTPRCIGEAELDPAAPTGFAVRLDSSVTNGMSVRYRILSTKPYSPGIVIVETPGCSIGVEDFHSSLEPLDAPVGAHLYATEWTTTSSRWCMDPTAENGVILSLGVGCPQQPASYRLVIERVQAEQLGQ